MSLLAMDQTAKKAEKNSQKISHQTKSNFGFTLMEILVAMLIMVAALSIALPRLGRSGNPLKKITHEMSLVIRQVRVHSRLTQRTFRIAFRFGDPQEPSAYWIESSQTPALIDRSDENKKPVFTKTEALFKGDRELPGDVKWVSLEIENEKPVSEGVAYIYVSAEGLVEKSALTIEGPNQNKITLVFNPLTGRAITLNKSTELRELENE